MGRSQSTSVGGQAQTNATTDQASATAAKNLLMPSLQNELTNPGYTPAQQTAITGATEGGIGAAFGTAEQGAANRAARTNNSAGLTSDQDALARQRMITSGQLGAENQVGFANAARADRTQAQGGLGALYGQGLGAGNAALNTSASAAAASPSFWDQFGANTAKSLGTFGGSAGGGNPASVGFG